MTLNTRTDVTEIEARGGLDADLTEGEAIDISDGVAAQLVRSSDATLFLRAEGAVEVHVYLSPDDDGSELFEPEQSPVVFDGSEAKPPIQIVYNASYIELVGTNQTPVFARVEEVV
jgi:hypothetical protein